MTPGGCDSLMLVAFGSSDELRPLLQRAAPRLAALLRLESRGLQDAEPPLRTMTRLRPSSSRPSAQAARDWVAALPLDPGLCLPEGGCWAEALGAWRQSTAALVTEAQLHTGTAAAGTALLRQWKVPLLGLIQWDGPWDRQARRRDGLPWLGILRDSGEDPEGDDDALRQTIALRRAAVLQGGVSQQATGTT